MDIWKVPSCTEVSTWSPDALIDYFRSCRLKDCEKIVKKQGISGRRFLEMTENDMQKFPKISVPMLIRIQQDINKKEEKKGLFPMRTETHKPHLGGHAPFHHSVGYDTNMSENWNGSGSDSFDDDDYEDPDASDDGADYESPNADDDEGNSDVDYEPPPSNELIQINQPRAPCGDQFYVGRSISGNPSKNPPDPPLRPESSTHHTRGNTFPGVQSSLSQEDHINPKQARCPFAPSIDRTKKPKMVLPPNTGTSGIVTGKSEPVKANTLPAIIRPPSLVKPDPLKKPPLPGQPSTVRSNFSRQLAQSELSEEDGLQKLYPHSSNTFPSTSPKPSMRNIHSGSNTLPGTDSLFTGGSQTPGGLLNPPCKPAYKPPPEGNTRSPAQSPFNHSQQNDDLSLEQWYLGTMSRKDAERALRSINQDGTFLVRNCSQSSVSQPYVLMVLYKNKVYNVRIRYNQESNVYLLGSGAHETFSSVPEIIDFFRSTKLLLIDGKDRGSRQHCKLSCIASRNFH
ncbi:lymphocyte cytosolic protein 2 isoform X2 [Rana temporaria]|uniref:lymphocyte cytosolic protein 2 isoform X2 n=1 Tax=Rana temporaria TaxID=8407 RepID=UPI001AAD55B8|nr:lymphocyte cytosolic protein 2 isoform X2 [Rana temporaria]